MVPMPYEPQRLRRRPIHSHEDEGIFGILHKRVVGRARFVLTSVDNQRVQSFQKFLLVLFFGKGEEANDSNGHGGDGG
jgi:hypothetical protein